jgi:hypothetical protein
MTASGHMKQLELSAASSQVKTGPRRNEAFRTTREHQDNDHFAGGSGRCQPKHANPTWIGERGYPREAHAVQAICHGPTAHRQEG